LRSINSIAHTLDFGKCLFGRFLINIKLSGLKDMTGFINLSGLHIQIKTHPLFKEHAFAF